MSTGYARTRREVRSAVARTSLCRAICAQTTHTWAANTHRKKAPTHCCRSIPSERITQLDKVQPNRQVLALNIVGLYIECIQLMKTSSTSNTIVGNRKTTHSEPFHTQCHFITLIISRQCLDFVSGYSFGFVA